MKKLLLPLLLFIITTSALAQAPDFPQVFSPNAAELGKYGKMPVDYFSGLPQITIPLTELRARNYTLPIYLSYHASGNKPDQHPGWVGQGWSLHAGGCINRIVNGVKDEYTSDEYRYRYPNSYSSTLNIGYLYHMQETQGTDWDNSRLKTELENSIYYPRDHAPDEFQVNVEGLIASFYFIGNGQIKIVSRNATYFSAEYELSSNYSNTENLNVYNFQGHQVKAKVYQYISKIILTAADGTRYHFGGTDEAIEFSVEQLRPKSSYEWDLIATPNTWMLTRIERPDGENVLLSYQHSGVPIVFHDRHYAYNYSPNTILFSSIYYSSVDNHPEKPNQTYVFLLPSYLTGIECSHSRDRISFKTSKTTELDYSIDPSDFLNNTHAGMFLDSLKVRSWYLQLDTIKTLRGDISLEFTSNPNTRLKLNTIRFLNNGVIDHSYQMAYNATALPPYNARKSDIWGYYGRSTPYAITPFATLTKRRMQVDTLLTQAEMLTSIVYPTGGRTEFTYESNRFSKVATQFPFEVVDSTGLSGGLRIKRITDYPADGQPEIRNFTYTSSSGTSSGILSGIPECFASGHHYTNDHYGQWWGPFYVGESYYYASYWVFSENNLNQLSTTDGRHTTYSRVVESRPGAGQTVFYYTNHDSNEHIIDVIDQPPAIVETIENRLLSNPFVSMELHRGLLESKEYYNEAGQLINKESFEYNPDIGIGVATVMTTRYFYQSFYRASVCDIITDFPCLQKKTVTTYPHIGCESLVETTEYEYDAYRNLVSETRYRGNLPKIKIEFKYAGDFPDGVYPSMVASGKVGVPIERRKFSGTILIEDELLTYKNFSGKILPWKHYLAPLGAGKSPQDWTYYSGDSVPPGYGTEDSEIVSRDVMGNPTTINERTGIQTIWTWDYYYVNPTGKTVRGINSSSPFLSETYSWSANCSGLTGKVDARGVSESYSYDGLGRLARITDSHGHVLKRFEYSYGPSANHIREISYNDAARCDSTVTESRFDGLGREQQVVDYGYGLNGADRSTWTEYDSCGRISKSWLPAATSASNLTAFSQESSASYSDTCAFEVTRYEDSPLDRPIKIVGAGSSWHSADKGIVTTYEAENGGNLIRDCFQVLESGDSLILGYKNYSDIHPCSAERTEDEDGGILISYTDIEERTLLERRFLDPPSGDDPILADTYYIYDTAGRLMMVVPPELSSRASTLTWFASYSQSGWKDVRDYAFQYRYDDYGRCIAKKLPGADWIYYAYDKGGYPIFSQDGNQRARGVWGFSLPDPLGRECLSGEAKRFLNNNALSHLNGNHIQAVRDNGNGGGNNLCYGYSIDGIIPLVSSTTVLNVQYWDDHSFVGENFTSDGVMFGSSLFGQASLSGEPTTDIFTNSKGLLTGHLSAPLGTLPDNTVAGWRRSVRYFNERGSATRIADTYSSGYTIRETNTYDFRELPTSRYKRLIAADTTALTVQYTYSYDKWARPLVTTHGLNGGQPVILSSNQYDALGHLSSVEHGGCDSLTTTFTYNTRGWTKSIAAPYFTENLYYETQRDTTSVPCWNGNISAMDWKTGADRTYNSAYDFRYDKMSRLTKALWIGSGSGRFNNRYFTYDLNGNINKLEREQSRLPSQTSHNLNTTIWVLNGNQMGTSTASSTLIPEGWVIYPPIFPLNHGEEIEPDSLTPNSSTSESRTAYGYDTDGNLNSKWTETRASTLDPWVAGTPFFETQYNFMNLPSYRRSSSTEEWSVYAANGEKQAVYHHTPATSGLMHSPEVNWKFEYIGNIIFRNGVPNRILTDSGHIDLTGDSPVYQWWLTDHLGNVRVVADSLGTISQTNHYDPYGGSIGVNTFSNTFEGTYYATENLFRFGGKEWNNTFSDYDFSARFFSTNYANFSSQDPLAEKTPHLSPYTYCAGNPMRFVDPSGMEWYRSEDKDGQIQFHYIEGDQDGETIPKNWEYVGLTYTDNASNTYYSLFGNMIKMKDNNGKRTVESELYERIDKLLIKAYTNDDGVGHQDFFIGIPPGEYGFSYNGANFISKSGKIGGTIFRAVNNKENSILSIRMMPGKEERRFGGYNNAPSWKGYFMVFYNNKRFDALQVNFDKENSIKFTKALNNVLKK